MEHTQMNPVTHPDARFVSFSPNAVVVYTGTNLNPDDPDCDKDRLVNLIRHCRVYSLQTGVPVFLRNPPKHR